MNVARLVAAAIFTLWILSPAFAETMPRGTVTLTKARGDALVVWDATDELATLVTQKPTKKAALERLESDAATIFGNRARSLKKTAQSLTVLVLYTRSGAISPTYHTATFEGIERLLTLKARVNDYPHAAQWARQLRDGHNVAGISLNITGQMPPELP